MLMILLVLFVSTGRIFKKLLLSVNSRVALGFEKLTELAESTGKFIFTIELFSNLTFVSFFHFQVFLVVDYFNVYYGKIVILLSKLFFSAIFFHVRHWFRWGIWKFLNISKFFDSIYIQFS